MAPTKILRYDLNTELQDVFKDIDQLKTDLTKTSLYDILTSVDVSMMAADEKAVIQDLIDALAASGKHISVRVGDLEVTVTDHETRITSLEGNTGVSEDPKFEKFTYDAEGDVKFVDVYTDSTMATQMHGTEYIYATINTLKEIDTSTTTIYAKDGATVKSEVFKDYAYTADNNVDSIATSVTDYPVIQSAGVTSTDLTMTYDDSLDIASTPGVGDFVVTVTPSGGTATNYTVSAVTVSGKTIVLTLGTAVVTGDAVVLDYTAGTAPIQNTSANLAANLVDYNVTNNS